MQLYSYMSHIFVNKIATVGTNSVHIKNNQHDLTPRIYVLHKITIALKFMSYINQKLQPSYQTALNLYVLHKLKISARSARGRAVSLTGNWRGSLIQKEG